jgi:hypothetical protein
LALLNAAFSLEADLRRTYISILELGHQQPTLTTILKLAKPLKHSSQEIVGKVEAELRQGAPGAGGNDIGQDAQPHVAEMAAFCAAVSVQSAGSEECMLRAMHTRLF